MVVLETDGSTRVEEPGDADFDYMIQLGKNHDVEFIGFMSEGELAEWNVVMWWTWWVVPGLKRFLTTAEGAGWNTNQQKTGVGSILVAYTVAPSLAATLANQIVDAFGGSGSYPKPSDLNIADCPIYFKKLIDA
jgi:hypothetical protein